MTVTPQENSSLAGVIVAVIITATLICAVVYCWQLQLKWRGGQHRPNIPIWNTALSYYSSQFRRTVQDGPNSSILPLNFHNFIRRDVIDIFSQQRIRRDQFAVLLFIPQNVDLNTIDTRVGFYTTDVENERCLTHASYPFWPKDPQNFGNFMVARPEPSWSQHAEEILLEHFPKIWETYQQREGEPPKYVILYSWTMPCSKRCTPKLISCITSNNKYTESTKFIVAYTIHWYREETSDIERSEKSLHDSGVIVERVAYDKPLAPSYEEQRRASVTPPMLRASMPSSVEATPPPIDRSKHISHTPLNEIDMRLTIDKLRDLKLNLDDDKQPMSDSQGVPTQRLPYNSDSPWERLSQAESTEGDLSLHDENEWQLLTKEQKFE